MTAEIIEFPMRKHENRLVFAVAELEQIVREVERVAAGQPVLGLHGLLTIMERLGDRLVESSSLLFDENAQGQLEAAFTSLSAKIAQARLALDDIG